MSFGASGTKQCAMKVNERDRKRMRVRESERAKKSAQNVAKTKQWSENREQASAKKFT